MPQGAFRSPWNILSLALALLLALVLLPPFWGFQPPWGWAAAVQNQGDPTACEAVGNNWTSCQGAFLSDNLHAYANGSAGAGSNDFTVQRGFTTIPTSQSSATITAGTDYGAPASLSRAFVRIVGTRLAGIGTDAGGGPQQPRYWMATVTNPGNLLTSITFARYFAPSTYNTRIYWEIVEYTGSGGGGNEFVVRGQAEIEQTTGIQMDGPSATVTDDNDVVVFITGQRNDGSTSGDTDRSLYSAEWVAASDIPRFTRGNGVGAGSVSYAVVEFTGSNWKVQRAEHAYSASGTWETETIASVNSLSRAFLHVQMRTASGNVDEMGQQVYLSAVDTASFRLRVGADIFSQFGVAWIVENTQTDGTPMSVQRVSGIRSTGPPQPDEWTETITAVADTATTSIMGETADSSGTGTAGPRGSIGLEVTSPTTVTLWRSDTARSQDYRFEVLEWPTAPSSGPGTSDTAWKNFGFALADSDAINSVEVGLEWFRNNTAPILNVTVSWDGGITWAPNQTAANKSLDDNVVEFLDFTSVTAWNASKLSDANLRVRVGSNASGARLDYLTARVTFTPNAAPQLSNFRLEEVGGVSRAGDLLEVDVSYHFIFNVTDADGWLDVGQDGFVALHLWYDGNASPELTFTEQIQGPSYRIDLRYQDVADPGNVTLDEWSVAQGLATYDATASSLTEIWSGSLLVGYEFRLALRLGVNTKHATDPINGAPGGYNDLDSWNAEVEGTDGVATTVLQTASAGEHVEFGVVVDPILAYDASTLASAIQPGQTATFRVNFTNEGKGEAAFVWVNVTLAPELRYMGDDAATIGGVRSGTYSFEFTGVVPGLYAFNLTVAAEGGVPDGTTATTRFAFASQDLLQESLNAATIDVPVLISSAVLDLTLTPDGTFLDPGDTHVYSLNVRNIGAGDTQNLLVQASVDVNVTYVSSSPSGTYNGLTRTLGWTAPSLGAGGQLVFAWAVQVNLGAVDLAGVTARTRVDYEDGNGTALPPVEATAQSAVRVPGFSPLLLVDRTGAERGDEVVATLHYNNTGSGVARFAWINWSLGGHYELVSLAPALSPTKTPDGFVLALMNVTSGSHTLVARLRVLRGLQDGLPMGLQVSWAATDGNGNSLSEVSLAESVMLLAPRLTLTLQAATQRVEVRSTFLLNVTVGNEGLASGTAWLNLSLPAGFRYVADNGTLPVEATDGRITWRLASLAPNGRLFLSIELQANGGARVESLRLSLDYTDGRGTPPATAFSNALSVEVFEVGAPGLAWWWLALPLVTAGALLASLLIRRRLRAFSIEEVFVMDTRGVLISHLSRTLTPDKDSDLLATMLKTLQDFVMDAFSTREEAPMRRVEFGQYNILMERGRHHWLAIVFRGEDYGVVAARAARLSEQVDLEYGEVLEVWRGEMSRVRGIQDLLKHLWEDEGRTLGPLKALLRRLRGIRHWKEGAGAESPTGSGEEDTRDPTVAEFLKR